MIVIGQYVRAILAEGLAAALPSMEGFEHQLDREGVVIDVHPDRGTVEIEDFFGHEHVCHLTGAVIVDPSTLDPYLHNWASERAVRLGVEVP